MNKNLLYITILLLSSFVLNAQDEEASPVLGLEILTHNMLKFNKHIINPAFSAGQDQSSISVFHRRQWAAFNESPEFYYLGYSGTLGGKMGVSVGAFQQSVGVFSNTGAILNYSYSVMLSDENYLTFGINTSVYMSGINGGKVVSYEDPLLMELENSFIVNAQPGINLTIGGLDVGVYAENMFDYNISASEMLTEFGEKTFSGHLQYTLNFEYLRGIFENSRLVSLVRARKLQDETSFAGGFLFDAPEIGWFQLGYESIYGASAGIGFNIANSFALGYVAEKGMGDGLKDFGLTHEITLAYTFNHVSGNNNNRSTSRSRNRRTVRRKPISRPTAPVRQTPPVVVEETPPVIVEETPPVVRDEPSASDILNAKDAPPVVEETPPVVVEETPPVVVEEETPPVVVEETPPVVVEETPPVVVEETPPVVVEETPPVVVEETPPVVAEETPPVVVEETPEVALTKEQDSIRRVRQAITKENEEVIKELETARNEFVSEEDLEEIAAKKAQELYGVTKEEGEDIEGIQSGYYIISNTYITERYLNTSISRLKAEGIEANYFYNPKDELNYVYLGRYDTMEEVLEYYKNNEEVAFNNRTTVYKVENDDKQDVVKDKENKAEVRQVIEVPGMESGFYMVTNVFAIPENAEYELQKMREQGLNVNSFVNPKNLYIYIYLENHDTFEEAEKAYHSNLNGTYEKEVLIMSVNQ